MDPKLANFTDILGDEIPNSQPLSLPSSSSSKYNSEVQLCDFINIEKHVRPSKCTGQYGEFRSIDEIDPKYKDVFSYRFFNLVQSRVIDDALYSDKSMVVCAPTGSGKTVIFEMAIVQLLMDIDDKKYDADFKIIYMAPVKALCTERLTEWYPKFTKLGLLCIEVTGDTDVDFNQLKPYRIIITTPEKWDMLTRRWRDHRGLVEVIKLFLIDEVHILNDVTRGPVLEAVVSRMKTIEASTQSTYRIEQLQKQYGNSDTSTVASLKTNEPPPRIRFIAVSATVSNPEDVATWLGTNDKPAAYYKFGDECRPVVLKRVVEGYPCQEGTSIFKFDIILNYKLWPIIQKYHNGKPTLIFCNTRKSVILTAETLSRELTINFNPEQKTRLTALASTIKNKKLQSLILSGVGCHHAGLLYEERLNIEKAFRNRDLPILITTTTLAMGVNLPAHLVIIKNTQQYVNGAYQEYSISTVLQMVGRAGRPQFDTEATAVIMTRAIDKSRYEALVCGSEPLQSYLHKRLPENLNSEAALGTVNDVAQCVQWLCSTFLYVRAASDPKRYLGLPTKAPHHMISKKIEELCVRAMNGLATAGLITMDEACCIESTEAGRLMSIYYLDLETMKLIMKIDGTESLDRLLWLLCESHELADMHLRVDERRCLNSLNRNNAAATIRFPMKGKISTRQMKANCVIQATLGCLPIPDPSLNQEAMKTMRIADRVCKCLVAYVTRPVLISGQPKFFSAVYNSLILAKCIAAHLWENSPYVSKQLKGIGPTFSTLLATAGKINFMLLEESHPRDLERIMNKGAPAGNVVRKQTGLLPKYQITMTPIDERVVSVQLLLLNHSYLSENMEHLTAGETHKSYIVAGDSENHVLLLTSFKDKNLISVYDGCITHELTRIHNFEHKVIVHCISSNFVGIDAQCEYIFKDLEPIRDPMTADTNSFYFHGDSPQKKTSKKQTCITDTFKERKRKSTDANITQSKEKKKRENALSEKIRILKESFGKASKELKEDRLQKSENIAQNVSLDTAQKSENEFVDLTNVFDNNEIVGVDVIEFSDNKYMQNSIVDDFEADDFMDDIKINNILNEIESEISKGNSREDSKKRMSEIIPPVGQEKKYNSRNIPVNKNLSWGKSQNKASLKKTNYSFIDLLEKNTSLNDDDQPISCQKGNYFSETIKQHINKYLEKTEHLSKLPNTSVTKFIENNTCDNDIDGLEKTENVDVLPVIDFNPLKSIKTNVENNATVLDIDKQLIYDHSNMQINENDNKDHSENCNLYSLIDKKIDKCNTHKENDEPIENQNDVVTKFEDILVESPIQSINDTIDAQIVTDVRNTISEKVVQHSVSEGIKTKDQAVALLSLVPFEYSKSTVENNVIDSRTRIKENHHNNIFNDLMTSIKSTEIEKSCVISAKQTMPTITFANDIPDWDIVQINESNENPTGMLDYCKPTNTLNTINDFILTGNNIATQKGQTKEDSYQKSYFYSTSNVNISTHNTEKHQIRIIKRLKVDLDITQIVTRNDNIEQKADDKDLREDVRPTSSSNLFSSKKVSAESAMPELLIFSDSETKIQPVKYTSVKEIDKSEKIIDLSRKNSKNYKEIWPVNYEYSKNDKFIARENKLENILQKYNEVLRKKNANDNKIINEPKNIFHEYESDSKIEKKKRPFKITDIDKVDVKLPLPTWTSESQPIPKRIEVQTVKEDIEEPQTIDEHMNIMETNLIEDHTALGEMSDGLESITPVPTSDLTSDNFKLDQSMFDPKTVLQCLSKDDAEIIPPPSQFCDANYSPALIAQDNLDNELYGQIRQNMCNIADFCEITSGDTESDISEDETFKDNLTPSTEIDTWLLTQDHDRKESVEESYTITHKNLSGQSNRHRDNIHTSRHTNLNNFKFVNKKKLKI